MLGGGSNLLIGDLIEMQFLGNSYNPNLGAAISLVLMVIILLIMTILNQFVMMKIMCLCKFIRKDVGFN